MMATRGFVHLPVVDEHCRPLGVVNARDALRALTAEEKHEAPLLRDYIMGVGYR
jgi:CBS domain-containing protein